MYSRKVKAPFYHDFIVIKCDCGQQFSVLSYQERNEGGYDNSLLWHLEKVYYCPFCGKKNDKM